MDKAYIIQNWNSQIVDPEASRSVWDMNAPQYTKLEIPTAATSYSMYLASELGLYNRDSDVLDIGCGAGRFTIAFSDLCRTATGTDLSPKMIEAARARAEHMQRKNVFFVCDDWHSMNISDYGWAHKFDLTFANMTPAVQSEDTFRKLLNVSRGWCFMCKPTRRTDLIEQYLLKHLDLPDGKACSFDLDMMYAYDLLWLEGYLPKVDYEQLHWHRELSLAHAQTFYTAWIRQRNHLSEEQEKKIPALIRDLSSDETVTIESDVLVSYLYWHV